MGYWLVDTAGIGSIIVLVVGFSVLVAYAYMLRWIQKTPPERTVVADSPGEEAARAEAGGETA